MLLCMSHTIDPQQLIVPIVFVLFGYSALYVVLSFVNRALAGGWQYAVLNKIGFDIKKWIGFMFFQLAILCCFFAANLILMRVPLDTMLMT